MFKLLLGQSQQKENICLVVYLQNPTLSFPKKIFRVDPDIKHDMWFLYIFFGTKKCYLEPLFL